MEFLFVILICVWINDGVAISSDDYDENTIYLATNYKVMSLLSAIRNGDFETVQTLFTDDVGIPRFKLNEALRLAAEKGYGKIVDILIQNGADVNAGNPSTEKTPLHFAAASGSMWAVTSLIKAGANVNAVDIENQTPLHFAAYKGDDEIVKILVDNEADQFLVNKNGETPLNVGQTMYRSYSFDNFRKTIELLQGNVDDY